MQSSNIHFEIDLDDDGVPQKIRWDGSDKPGGEEETRAVSIAVWDGNDEAAMRMDLWTPDMAIDDMKGFYINAIAGMAESLEAATGDSRMAEEMLKLCEKLVEIAREDLE